MSPHTHFRPLLPAVIYILLLLLSLRRRPDAPTTLHRALYCRAGRVRVRESEGEGRHRRPFSAQTCVVQGTRTERLFRPTRAFRFQNTGLSFFRSILVFDNGFLNTPSSSTVFFLPPFSLVRSIRCWKSTVFLKKKKYYLAFKVVTVRGPSIREVSSGQSFRRVLDFLGDMAVAQTQRWI